MSAAVRPTIRPADVESWGVPRKPAEALAARIEAASQRRPGTLDAREQERFWLELRAVLLANPETRWRFAAHFACTGSRTRAADQVTVPGQPGCRRKRARDRRTSGS